MIDASRGKHCVAGMERAAFVTHADEHRAFEHDVHLVGSIVAVGLLRLTRLETVHVARTIGAPEQGAP